LKDTAFAAHRAAASGLFTLFSLFAIVLGLGDARLLALATGGALVSLFALTRPQIRDSLGPFAAPLGIGVDLGLLFCAMSLTGGPLSPYALLLPAGAALCWHCEGKAAARFYAIASVLGVVALITLGNLPTSGAANLFPLVGVALAAPEPVRPRAERPAPSARERVEPIERDHQAEILHDLRSPLSVIRVYTDLIQEAARRGELPNAEYLANLAREIELAESLVGAPAPEPEPPAPAPQNADLVEILG
jgi:signal transduction histidine kinase